MDIHMDELDKNHEVLVSRVEDTEDDMQIVKTDVDVLRIEMSSFNKDIKDIEMLVDNAHLRLEKVEDHVDGFMSLLCSQTGVTAASSCAALCEVQRVEKELHLLIEGWYGKFKKVNIIINKKIIRFEEELDRVMALVGEKIQSGMEDLSTQFNEALEVEGQRYGVLARDMELVKSQLETAQENNVLLAGRLSAFQVRLLEVKDVLMEDADAEGEPSDLSSDLDPVQNMVAIPIPGPVVVHTLVPVEVSSEYIPPSLCITPSPPYMAELGEGPEHSGVPKYWVDLDAVVDLEVNQ
jgi:hypothetical protein